MAKTNKQIENALYDLLDELLESGNQEGSINSISYDSKTQKATIIMNVVIIEEDDYIGFQSY